MPELIDSGNVIAWLNVQIEYARRGDLPIDAIAYYGDAIMFVKNLPTIEAVPVRHGRWIDKGEYAVCAECGGQSGTQYDGVEPIPLMTQFCPHCGARMDGGDGNDT